MRLVAVYGSLRKGLGNHYHLTESKFIGTFKSLPKYTLHSLHGGFPGLKLNGNDSVIFEVYEVDDKTDQGLDWLEGYNPDRDESQNHYNKRVISTPWGDAFTYEYGPEGYGKSLDHGDWILFKTGKFTKDAQIEQERICEAIDSPSECDTVTT